MVTPGLDLDQGFPVHSEQFSLAERVPGGLGFFGFGDCLFCGFAFSPVP